MPRSASTTAQSTGSVEATEDELATSLELETGASEDEVTVSLELETATSEEEFTTLELEATALDTDETELGLLPVPPIELEATVSLLEDTGIMTVSEDELTVTELRLLITELDCSTDIDELSTVVTDELLTSATEELLMGVTLVATDDEACGCVTGVVTFFPLPHAAMEVVITASNTDLTRTVFAENIYNPRAVVFLLASKTCKLFASQIVLKD